MNKAQSAEFSKLQDKISSLMKSEWKYHSHENGITMETSPSPWCKIKLCGTFNGSISQVLAVLFDSKIQLRVFKDELIASQMIPPIVPTEKTSGLITCISHQVFTNISPVLRLGQVECCEKIFWFKDSKTPLDDQNISIYSQSCLAPASAEQADEPRGIKLINDATCLFLEPDPLFPNETSYTLVTQLKLEGISNGFLSEYLSQQLRRMYKKLEEYLCKEKKKKKK